jgi:magnesium chelatase family protein
VSFSKTHSAQPVLLKAEIIDVEVDISRGLHNFSIVGLPDKGVEESKDRVSAAIKNSGFTSPKQKNHKVVVSLAPADIKKEGPIFDLAIALSYLLASEEIKFNPKDKIFLGELSLDGKLRPIKGVLPLVVQAKKSGFKEIFLPKENAKEAGIIEGIKIFPSETLKEIIDHLVKPEKQIQAQPKTEIILNKKTEIDFCDIKGQSATKRALEIAAAGGHNLAMWGPAGTGKTLLAKSFSSILPPLSFEEMLEVTSIHSVSGNLSEDIITNPPFRNPHHTSSYVSIVGGGAIPKPGEATLAHRGVLFLDEFPEFDRKVIDTLREPLEEKIIRISRAKGSAKIPANFILIAALNPCPCGNWGSKTKVCKCQASAVERYKRKISGPIIDRIDLWSEVSTVDHSSLGENKKSGEESAVIKKRVENAREMQRKRFEKISPEIKTNSEISAKNINSLIELKPEVKKILDQASTLMDLSARSYHKLIKIARTIADLDQKEMVEKQHMEEALQYRPKNFKYE